MIVSGPVMKADAVNRASDASVFSVTIGVHVLGKKRSSRKAGGSR
jgi:hypothetical protein